MKPTLIIAEDLQEIREEIHLLLQDRFDVVASVDSAKAAIDACLRHEPDLLVIDVVMPEMSGIEGVERLLSAPPPHPEILFVSEVKNAPVMHRILQLGASFLQKPVDGKRLEELLLGLADRRQKRRPELND